MTSFSGPMLGKGRRAIAVRPVSRRREFLFHQLCSSFWRFPQHASAIPVLLGPRAVPDHARPRCSAQLRLP